MEALFISPWIVAIIFFFVAFLYASVGLGGGSAYTAILASSGASVIAIPSISLSLNVVVSAIASLNFIRAGHLRARLIVPFLGASVPMAMIGGSMSLPITWFRLLLLISLIIVAVRIYLPMPAALSLSLSPQGALALSVIGGGILGFIAGAVGIGGGVYLVPLILVLGLGTVKEAAAAGAVFVWVNSVAGLVARLHAGRYEFGFVPVLVVAAVSGALAGAYLGAGRFEAHRLEKMLGLVIVIACLLLAHKLWQQL